MTYSPLDADLLTSTVLKEGPDVVAVWVLLLASMDKLHETRLTPASAASLLRISDERSEAAFAVLASPDPKSRNQEHGGRRIIAGRDGAWMLVSGEKYARRASRAAASERQRRYLDRKTKRDQAQCTEAECRKAADCEVDGRLVCTEHAFLAPKALEKAEKAGAARVGVLDAIKADEQE